jgi:hypothetical protein
MACKFFYSLSSFGFKQKAFKTLAMDKLQKTESRFSVNISILASSIEGNLSISIVKGLTVLVKTRDALPVLYAVLWRMCVERWRPVEALPPKIMQMVRQRDTPEGQLFKANTCVVFIEISKSLLIQ